MARMKEILGRQGDFCRAFPPPGGDSPAVLVSPDGGMTASMEKLLKVMQKDDPIPVKILEVNCDHPLLRSACSRSHKADNKSRVLDEMTRKVF